MRSTNSKLDRLDNKLENLTGGVHALDTKFTVQEAKADNLETKVTAELKDFEIRLTDKFTIELRDHGERLARIEAKLDIDPPAEAA